MARGGGSPHPTTPPHKVITQSCSFAGCNWQRSVYIWSTYIYFQLLIYLIEFLSLYIPCIWFYFHLLISPNCNEIFLNFSEVSIIVCLVWAVINISSAYAEHCFKCVDMLPLSSSCFKISSVTMLNRVADSVSV